MEFRKQLDLIGANFLALDRKKKIGLGAGFFFILAAVLLFTTIANKPVTATLYSNLSQQDINNMSRTLSQNSIEFSISSSGDAINVTPGMITKARMLLAENGLPSSTRSGYELFDKVNTLGLTSFMQNVTNKRAIQGELARTIQMIAGVKSARIHLVTNEKSVFRSRNRSAPSASLVISTFGRLPNKTILAIRHMVAAAVPGLDTDNVTIVGADGSLLTTKGDDASGGVTRLVELENEYEREAERKIIAALGAHLGSSNFRTSVSAKLNIDKRREDETTFDPDSRIERSFRSIKETGSAQNNATSQPTSVVQNLPDENQKSNPGQTSNENKERREETTNYEINTLKTSLVSSGYRIEQLSVALVVAKSRITQLLGDKPDKQKIDAKIEELQGIIRSAISLSEERNDLVNVSFVEFLEDDISIAQAEVSWFENFINTHLASILNSIALVIAALVFAILGIRPILAFLSRTPDEIANQPPLALGSDMETHNENQTTGNAGYNADATISAGDPIDKLEQRETEIKAHLENLISQNDERVAIAIRQWLQPENVSQ